MKLKRFARLRLGLWVLCILLCLWGSRMEGVGRYILFAVGAMVFLATVVLNGKYWRCPYCDAPLIGWYKNERSVCARCGKPLKEEWK